MRYAVISKGLKLDQLELEISKVGGRDLVRAQILGQIFCELDEAGTRSLSLIP